MDEDKTHVYLMPGMAAGPNIFEYIKLPENKCILHYMEWIMPERNESLPQYVLRISAFITHKNPVLIGVSFGGILVQEISKLIKVKKLIIISSIKHKDELPRRMKWAKITGTYTLLPTKLAGHVDFLSKFLYGKNVNKRLELYKKYLSVNDNHYLKWVIKQTLCWEQTEWPVNIIHIHGDRDTVFPIKNIKNTITVKGGTHAMIIYKYKWFNENLPHLILEN
ncbi:MAG: alpha/beta hydrolase [Aestuariibaculum sp.]